MAIAERCLRTAEIEIEIDTVVGGRIEDRRRLRRREGLRLDGDDAVRRSGAVVVESSVYPAVVEIEIRIDIGEEVVP